MNIDIQNLDVKLLKPYYIHIYEADLMVDGEKVCIIKNTSGQPGGGKFENIIEEKVAIMNRAIESGNAFPTRYIPYNNDISDGHEIIGNLAALVEDIVIKKHDPMKHIRDAVFLKKLSQKGIVLGYTKEPVETYTCLFMRELDIEAVLNHDNALQQFREFLYHQLKHRWADGMQIFNNNLSPEDILVLGLNKYFQTNEPQKNRLVKNERRKRPKR